MRNIDINQPVSLNVEPVYVPKKEISDDDRQIAKRFGMPDCALDLVDFFFTEEDQDLILHEKKEIFNEEDVDADYLKDAFKRGVINKADTEGYYTFNNFYGMLDVFSVSQTKKYRTLTREKRKELDDWYFQSYVDSLDPDYTHRPTADAVLTKQEMLDFIDQEDRPLYLNYCDCKSLSGDCGLPSHTCINFVPGPNSFVARGLSMKLTKEEAKQVIEKADEAGLVHTLSSHGICNCCDDCCYLFRGQRIRRSTGFWPRSDHIIHMDQDRCVACGKCVTRCHFHVFEKIGKGRTAKMQVDTSTCVGCGLCANTCPTKALSLETRTSKDIHINEA